MSMSPGQPELRELDWHEARARHEAGDAVFVDIRDPESFAEAHIPGAVHLAEEADVKAFLSAREKGATVIVYCYHGNSSRGAALWFGDQGFTDVWSMAGGFEAWRYDYPVASAEDA
jgi:thiosulfate sulfurtransferase